MIIGKFVAIMVLSYLLGAIPFSLIVGKLIGGVDVSKYGSGNIGGTNVLRTLGKKAGVLAMFLDLIKATAAVVLARVIMGDSILLIAGFPVHWQITQVTAAFMAMIGHSWSVFIKFRGGRGVATYFGSWFALSPAAALFGGEILLLIVLRTKYMSMGSIFGVLGILCLLIPLTLIHGYPPVYLVYGLLAAALIIYQHRDNISRLQTGTELRLDDNAPKASL